MLYIYNVIYIMLSKNFTIKGDFVSAIREQVNVHISHCHPQQIDALGGEYVTINLSHGPLGFVMFVSCDTCVCMSPTRVTDCRLTRGAGARRHCRWPVTRVTSTLYGICWLVEQMSTWLTMTVTHRFTTQYSGMSCDLLKYT